MCGVLLDAEDRNPLTATSWTRALYLSNRDRRHVAMRVDDARLLLVEKERVWTDDSIHRDDASVLSVVVAERHDGALVRKK